MNGSVREERQARLNKEWVCVFAERGSGPALRKKRVFFLLPFFWVLQYQTPNRKVCSIQDRISFVVLVFVFCFYHDINCILFSWKTMWPFAYRVFSRLHFLFFSFFFCTWTVTSHGFTVHALLVLFTYCLVLFMYCSRIKKY